MIRSSTKTRQKRRAEQKVIDSVRPIVAERDGYCRIAADVIQATRHPTDFNEGVFAVMAILATCAGPSEWAHLGDFKRFKTRKQAPEQRHQTEHTAMLCAAHHDMYDANQFVIEELTEAGADGPLAYRLK